MNRHISNKKGEIDRVVSLIKNINPQAFYTIEDIRFINEDTTLYKGSPFYYRRKWFTRKPFRKGK